MLFLYYPKCSTCQKAKKWLDANHKAHPEYKIAISEYGGQGRASTISRIP